MICIAVLPRGGLSETQNLFLHLLVPAQLSSNDTYLAPFTSPGPDQHGEARGTRAGEREIQGEVTGQRRPRSLKMVQSAEGGKGKDKRERVMVVVRIPSEDSDPADAHPNALKSVLESANPRMDSDCASGCPWSTARATARLWDGRPPE